MATYVATVEYEVRVEADSMEEATNKIIVAHSYDGCDYAIVDDPDWVREDEEDDDA